MERRQKSYKKIETLKILEEVHVPTVQGRSSALCFDKFDMAFLGGTRLLAIPTRFFLCFGASSSKGSGMEDGGGGKSSWKKAGSGGKSLGAAA